MSKKSEVDALMKTHGVKRTMANNMLRTRKSVKKGSLTDSEGKPLKLKRKSVAKNPPLNPIEYRQYRKLILAKRTTKTAPKAVHTKAVATSTNKKKK